MPGRPAPHLLPMSPKPHASAKPDPLSILQTSLHGRWLFRLVLCPAAGERLVVMLLVVAMVAGIAALVEATGGTRNSALHLAYLPVLLAALFFGPLGGIGAGVVAGLALGPGMPLDSATGEAQSLVGWGFRLGFFALMGGVVGAAAQFMRQSASDTLLRGLVDETLGLPSRSFLVRLLSARLKDAKGETLFLLDLRGLRPISIAFGIGVAERALRATAKRLGEMLPPSSQLFHVGPGQLAVLAPTGRPEEGAAALGEVLSRPVEINALPLTLDAVVGAAPIRGASTAEEVLRRAALAVDQALERGLAVGLFATETEAELRDRLRLLGDFRQGVGAGQIEAMFQPKVRLSDGKVIGCEALARWRHPERGLVPPGRFIPLVEFSGLIGRLTGCILREALEQVARWAESGARIPVSVNMSARDLSSPETVEATLNLIDDIGLDRELVDVEVTESAAFHADVAVGRQLKRLRDAGLTLSIDDFGTGMSSLSYLKRIPANHVKIDQMFVRGVANDRADRVMVESTIAMCHRLGLDIVAEGVENAAIARTLRDLGCDMGQGYYFGRPLPPDDLLTYWRGTA